MARGRFDFMAAINGAEPKSDYTEPYNPSVLQQLQDAQVAERS